MENRLLFVGLLISLSATSIYAHWHNVYNDTDVPMIIQFGKPGVRGYDEAYIWKVFPKSKQVEHYGQPYDITWTHHNCIGSIKVEGTGRLAGKIVKIDDVNGPCSDFDIKIEEEKTALGQKVLQVSAKSHEGLFYRSEISQGWSEPY